MYCDVEARRWLTDNDIVNVGVELLHYMNSGLEWRLGVKNATANSKLLKEQP